MAGTGGVNFNGISAQLPGVYTQVDATALNFAPSPGAPIVYLIGNSVGGQPNTVLGPFGSYRQAAQTLQGGDALDGARFAFKAGAAQVAVWRPYSATHASLSLKSASGAASVNLTSVDYGAWTNSLLASISGTPGALTATLKDNYHNTPAMVSPPLGGALLMTYTGNATSAVVTVVSSLTAPVLNAPTDSTTGGTIAASTDVYIVVEARNASGNSAESNEESVTVGATTSTNSVTVTWTAVPGATSYDVYVGTASGAELYYGNVAGAASGTITATITDIPTGTAGVPTEATAGYDLVTWLTGATDGSQNLDISLTAPATATIRGLSGYINGQPGYTAQVQTGAGSLASNLIDLVNAASITGAGYTLTSDIGTVVNWFNSTGIVTAVAAPGATAAPAAVGLTPFGGGSNGATTVSDWVNAGSVIATNAPLLRYAVPLTSTLAQIQAVQAGVDAAAQPPSENLGELFAGGAVGETQATALTNIAALNDRRVVYLPQSDFTDYNSSGVLTSFGGYMAAAYVAGLRASLAPQMPLTGKTVNLLKLNQTLTASQVATLNQGGGAALMTSNNGTITVSLGTTTDISSSDYNNVYYVEESVGNAIDQTRMYLANLLNSIYKGQPNYGTLTTQNILATVNSALTDIEDKYQWISGFTPASTVEPLSTNPTYAAIPLTLDVVDPLNGMVLSIALQMPLSSTSTGGQSTLTA